MGAVMQRPRVVVIGSSFAGLTGALELRRRMGDDADVVVVDRRDHFTFIPSLVWVPFGTRAAEDVTFPLAPTYADRGISFVQDVVRRIDLAGGRIELAAGEPLPYDSPLVATGPHLDFARVPESGPTAPARPSRSATWSTPFVPRTSGSDSCTRPAPSWSARRRAAPASAPPTSSCSTSPIASERPDSQNGSR